MSEFKEFSGKNIDEAIEEACKKFKASRDKLEIEILSGGSTGIFGLVGVKKATVRARMRQAESAAQEKGPKQQPKPKDKQPQPQEQQPKEQQSKEQQSKEQQSQAKAKDKPKGQEQAKPKDQQPKAKDKGQPQAGAKDQAEADQDEGKSQAGQPGEKPDDDKPRQSRGRGRRRPKAKPAQQEAADQAEHPQKPVQKQADGEQPQNGKPGGRRRGGRRRPRKSQDAQNAGPKNGNGRKQAANGNGNDFDNGNGMPAAHEKPVDDTEAMEAKDLVLDVVGKLIEPIVTGVKLSAEVEPGRVKVIVEDDENAGLIIGSDGQTISSLQYLANRIVARQVKGNVRVHLDAGDYRERQDDSLRQLAWSLADKAKNQGRTQATRPLSSYHRRVVHMALQEDDGIQTLSKGEGPMKRVLILPRPRNNH